MICVIFDFVGCFISGYVLVLELIEWILMGYSYFILYFFFLIILEEFVVVGVVFLVFDVIYNFCICIDIYKNFVFDFSLIIFFFYKKYFINLVEEN